MLIMILSSGKNQLNKNLSTYFYKICFKELNRKGAQSEVDVCLIDTLKRL